MAKKGGLGKGLDALFAENTVTTDTPVSVLRLSDIVPNRDQPRKQFDELELQALADSITANGLIQPLALRRLSNGYYQIIAGERRWRACRLAGLEEVPAVILEADDQKAMELALIENLQRQDLNPVEEALGYQNLMQDYALTQEQVAQQVGKSRPAIANALRLLQLPEEILDLLASGALSAGHARALLQLQDAHLQAIAAQKITALDLSVRQAERLCKQMSHEAAPKAEPEAAAPLEVDYIAECEAALSRQLGRGVKIINGKRKGRFELEFYGQEDLQRLLELLSAIPAEGGTSE